MSDGAARLLGYRDGELVGSDAFDLVHPDDQASALEGFDSTVTFVDSRPTPVLLRLRQANGSWLACEVIATNHLADGEIRGLLLSIRDVSASMRTEQALRESEERYRLIVELAREGIWVIDADALTDLREPGDGRDARHDRHRAHRPFGLRLHGRRGTARDKGTPRAPGRGHRGRVRLPTRDRRWPRGVDAHEHQPDHSPGRNV